MSTEQSLETSLTSQALHSARFSMSVRISENRLLFSSSCRTIRCFAKAAMELRVISPIVRAVESHGSDNSPPKTVANRMSLCACGESRCSAGSQEGAAPERKALKSGKSEDGGGGRYSRSHAGSPYHLLRPKNAAYTHVTEEYQRC